MAEDKNCEWSIFPLKAPPASRHSIGNIFSIDRRIKCHIIVLAAAMAVAFITLLSCQAAMATETKRVLVLHSFSREVKPWKEMSAEIHKELARQSRWPLDIVDQSIVTARNEDDKSEIRFVEYLD